MCQNAASSCDEGAQPDKSIEADLGRPFEVGRSREVVWLGKPERCVPNIVDDHSRNGSDGLSSHLCHVGIFHT